MWLGVLTAECFANGHAAIRILLTHPARPLLPTGLPVLWLVYMSLWIVVVMLLMAIWKLGNKQMSDWYLGVIGASISIVATYASYYVRTQQMTISAIP